MNMSCERMTSCPFFEKFHGSSVYQEEKFRKYFCSGPMREKCVRRSHARIFGCLPSDDLAPSGLLCR